MKNLSYKYLVYIIYFLGTGLTSSGIVLMPFNTLRYSIILGVGLCLFIAGSVFNEIVIENKNLSLKESIKLVILSLTLALGIGMISGGISHFKESPTYVSYLIPLGIIVSFVSFTLKNKISLTKRDRFIVFAGVNMIAVFIFIGLSVSASQMNDTPHGGDVFKECPMDSHGHS